jgi:hypothetical protein
MKRKIIVTINADTIRCVPCDWRVGTFCHLFGEHLKDTTGNGEIRCRACLAAERKAKGEGK